MITSVYFSTESVQIAVGRIHGKTLQIQLFHQESVPEASLLNGVITNEGAMKSLVKRLLAKGKLPRQKIDLLVDSSSILVKRTPVPVLPAKKLLALTKDEFSEFGNNYEELLYDYSVLTPKNEDGKGGVILCSAMERRFLENYIELFEGQNMKLRSIDLALVSQIRLAQFLPELKGKTYVLSILEGNSVVSSLFVAGQYMLTNRTRLLAERGTIGATTEMTRTISSLMQFSQAQKTGQELKNAYLCGLRETESQLCAALSETLLIDIQPLPDSNAIQIGANCDGYQLKNAFYVTGNLLRREGGILG